MADPNQLIVSPSQVDPSLGAAITSPSQADYLASGALPDFGGAVDDDTYNSVLAGLETGADPAEAAQPAPAVPAPAPVAPAPQTSTKQSASVGSSRSASVSGYSEAKNRQVASGPGARLNQQIAADKAQIEADYAPILRDQDANYVHQLLANDQIAATESAKAAEVARGKFQVAQAYDRFKNEEEFAYAEAQAAAAQAFQGYKTSLAEWGAMRVNPGALFGRATTGQRISMGAAAFVHDFLGAKGIRTSAMDTLNGLMDRDINAQLANMQHKGQVTAGFKNLWDMQRAQSATDAEARARVRGFVLESLGAEIEGELAKYDSRLVQDKALAARALIEQEKIKNDLTVRNAISQAHNQMAGHRVAAAGDQLRASTAYAQMSSAERIAAMNNAAELAKAKIQKGEPDPLAFEADLLADVTTAGGNKASRRFLRGTPDAKKTEIRTKAGIMSRTVEGVAGLEALHKKAGNRWDLLGTSRFANEAQRNAAVVENYLAMAIAYARSGKSVNVAEIEKTTDFLKNDTWFTNGDNIRKLNHVIKLLMSETNAEISANSVKLKPGDPGYGYDFGPDSVGAGIQTEADIKARGEDAPVTDGVDRAAGMIGGRGNGRIAREGTTFPVPGGGLKTQDELWSDFVKSSQGPKTGSSSPGVFGPKDVPEYFVGMGDLAKQAIDDPSPEDDAEAKKARELLEMWALAGIPPGEGAPPAPAPNGKDPNDPLTREMIEAARYYSNLIK